ncbi:hypothetical protein SAY86_021210 [Trapa natans]|uniref:Uncharacterized protein n=1 Tax=Trapa natans TaxID=22666 RepID=A0AAN7MYQ0_TRANT|nr:hypothetical protein SAY86_021210 [Trapa natans]
MALSRPFWLFTVVVFAATCGASGVGHMPPSNREEAAGFEEFKARTGQTGDMATKSWTGWAKEKISGGLGLKLDHNAKETAKRAYEKADHSVNTAKGKVQGVASRKGSDSYEKANEFKDSAVETAGNIKDAVKEKAGKTTEEAEKATWTMKKKAIEMAEEVRARAARLSEEAKGYAREVGKKVEEGTKRRREAEEQMGWAREKAREGYAAVREKAGETLETAKEKVGSNNGAVKQKSQEMKDDLTSWGRDEEQ